MRSLGIIPARYGSTRFPGKPLILINGKPMIQHVYETAVSALEKVIVATDDRRILETVEGFGGKAMMTSSNHQSGTDRCAEILQLLKRELNGDEVVINIQGDMPFIKPEQIISLRNCFRQSSINIATLIFPLSVRDFNPNHVKAIQSENGNILNFIRNPSMDDYANATYYKHLGIYGFRQKTLLEITSLSPTSLEISERLEQLRWLQNGYHIHGVITHEDCISIDVPEDLDGIEVG